MNAVVTKKITKIEPYKIERAMVALKLVDVDDTLLSYMCFLLNRLPIAGLQFIHVLQKNTLQNTRNKKFSSCEKQQKTIEQLHCPILSRHSSVHRFVNYARLD